MNKMPPIGGVIIRIAVTDIASEAFGNEFGDRLHDVYLRLQEDQS